MKKIENIIGFVLLGVLLIVGQLWFKANFFRLVVGLGFGYALSRAFMGFAGSVNRPYRTGSTKLIRTLVIMFLATTVITTAFSYKDSSVLSLWIRPINLGMILGGLLFGFGMSFSSCCATGVLTDLVTGLPRAFITLIFFGAGVFLGNPIQKSATWITKSVVSVGDRNGIFMPDMFKWDGMNGFLGATVLTALLAGLVILVATKYETTRKNKKTYTGVESENVELLNSTMYEKLFVNPWSLKTGAMVIVAFFAILTGISGSGWGASTIHGIWFGRTLNLFGVSAESMANFSKLPAAMLTGSYLQHPVAIQNFGIILGTFIYLLTAGIFKKTFFTEFKITWKEGLLFALGGLCMGFGTRFANGCNVGALYTPIANFSLSGWLYFAFLISGGIIGNKLGQKTKKDCIN
ncbi:YeeE/YedE family protein [Thiospirochaeta perfilievii]|uniref:YeeE/YedE family protein n=1 Tax=Thiospirochaeta perfilievii TaxID=252967 RepID=A0A5C1QDP0_9SPIO|nr:YeeE/YedE family protein [Thiospirochaeta perfilievii]QEN05497.1 YeeE/YedE family protein [Thiospirochaeta perfilievii]